MLKQRNKIKYILCILLLMFVIKPTNLIAESIAYKSYTQDGYGRYVRTQTAYQPTETLNAFEGEKFNGAEDIVLAEDGSIFVADTLNKRIIHGSSQGELYAILTYEDFVSPMGLALDSDNNLYVADPHAGAVFMFSSDLEFLRRFDKPTHPLFGQHNNFQPLKVDVDSSGIIYVISKGNSNGIIQLNPDMDDTFLAYFGANELRFSLTTFFRKFIFTDEQLSRMNAIQPPTPVALHIDEEGLVYTLTQSGTQGLKKLNLAGSNMFADQAIYNYNYPADVVTGRQDSIYVAEKDGYIYEYSRDGDLLFLFGAQDEGSRRTGLFSSVTAIDIDEEDRLYVLDSTRQLIQIFEPTSFADAVHEGLVLYQNGKYEESRSVWEDVLERSALFTFANERLGHAAYKNENYELALEQARIAIDYEGYSDAFWDIRNRFLRNNLHWVTLGFIAVVVSITLLQRVRSRKRQTLSASSAFWEPPEPRDYRLDGKLRYAFHFLKNPADGFYGLKFENRTGFWPAMILLVLFFIVYVLRKYFTGFLFKRTVDGRYELGHDAFFIFVGFFLIGTCFYLVTSIKEGECTWTQLIQGFAYSLTPYIVFMPWLVLLSHGLTYNESFILQFGSIIIITWCVVLLFLAVKNLNDYRAGETIKVILLGLFTVFVALVLAFIIYVLIRQLFLFFGEIIGEAVLRHDA